jgi:exonuclease 3'-5' domain-containing protein 1
MVLIDDTYTLKKILEKYYDNAIVMIDLEGNKLDRNGRISLLQIKWINSPIYIIDIFLLGKKAFQTKLKTILENEKITKLCCDPRNDSDALYHQYQIEMKHVFCVQLADVLYRRKAGNRVKYVWSLTKLIEMYCNISFRQQEEIKKIKEEGSQIMFPEYGGTYNTLFERPLHVKIEKYAENDVQYLYQLYQFFVSKLDSTSLKRIFKMSTQRVLTYLEKYPLQGPDQALAPKF